MEYRNPQWSINDWIDCEINHPKFGWIPFTANPDDTGATFDVAELYNQMKDDPSIRPYVPPPPEVPVSITRRQCSLQLLDTGVINGAEAIAMAQSAVPPAVVEGYIQSLPNETDRVTATIDFAAESYYRDNPLVNAILQANGYTPEQGDQFFIAAAAR